MKIHFITGTVVLILLCFVGLLFTSVTGLLLGQNHERLLMIFSQILTWLIPALIFARLYYDNFLDDLRLKKIGKRRDHIWFILIYMSLLPLISYLAEINEAVTFPEFMTTLEQWFREREQLARELTSRMASATSSTDLMLVLFNMAVLPAICEEVFFRGVVLNNLIKRNVGIHLSVWLSAILFSTIHFQFFGFLPRIVAGVILGYAFVGSRSLWVPIILHFLNNGLLVVAYFFFKKQWIPHDPLTEHLHVPLWLAALSLTISAGLLWLIFGRYNKEHSNSE
jgi:membrane protease YdiL (CAAX protease family)